MKLKEKFKKEGFSNCEYLEQVADDFAIEFAQWINSVSYRSFDGNWYLTQNDNDDDIKITTKELLEIYKKEKEL
jgi:hypothetical protein